MRAKLPGKLKTEITAAGALDYLSQRRELFCAVVVCLFLCTPIIEMVICFFSATDRAYPLLHYPIVVLNWVFPISVVLAAAVYLPLFRDGLRQRTRPRRLTGEYRAYLFFKLLVLCMLLSSLVTGTMSMWTRGDFYRNEPTGLVAAYFLVFFFCASQVRSPGKKERIAVLTVVFSMILGVYSSVHQWMVANGLDRSISEYSVAVFFQHNHYGYYLAVHIMLSSALFALSERRAHRVLGLAGLVLNTAELSMNTTFGAWLACFVAFFFQFIVLWIVQRRMSRRTLVGFGVFWAVTLLMHLWFPEILDSFLQFFVDIDRVRKDPRHSDSAGTNRWLLWKATVEKIGESPVFGFGNEGIGDVLRAVGNNSRPHNEFLQYAAFYGIPAALLYLCGVMSVFLKAYRRRATLDASSLICLIAAFAYLFSSLFGNTMFYTAPFLFLFLGMGYGLEKK